MNINDRVYIITTDCDDHIAVTVTPATVRRIITTQDLDGDGNTIETTAYMVRFDGERSGAPYHQVTEEQVVSTRYSYNIPTKIGDAVMAAIEAQTPKPVAVECAPPAPSPDEPF
jgi:hypothetical protein